MPQLVERMMSGDIKVDHFVTHRLRGVEAYNEAIEILEGGGCLRCVVSYATDEQQQSKI